MPRAEPVGLEALREWVEREAGRCIYCGFCEPVCPTRLFGHRGYGPRGRVNLALMVARGEAGASGEVVESLYTCLLCRACHEKCPAKIDIAGVVRGARALLAGDGLGVGR